jgi:hypothetical protein
MAFDIYGNRLRQGYCEVHPHVHESYPCSECCYSEPEIPMPEPTIEELCGPKHEYYGEDEYGPRCYCGSRRKFDGAA